MKKLILVVLAVFLMSGIASAATTLDLKGSFRVYPEMNNIGFSSYAPAYLSSASRETSQSSFVDQRARLIFNIKSNENVGGVVHLELDSRWGANGYSTTANRGSGGGLGSDSNNIEVKETYLWFKAGALTVKAGMQTFVDDAAGIFAAPADMAGFRADYALSRASSLSLGAFTWWDPTVGATDGVYFVPLTVKQQLGSGTLSLFVYTIQDNSNYVTNASSTSPYTSLPIGDRGLRPLPLTPTTVTASGITTVTSKVPYESAQLYYSGLNYGGKAGNVSYYLMGVYNSGKIKNVGVLGGAGQGDLEVSAFAANAKVDVKIGAGKLRFNSLWVTGDDSKDADKYPGFIVADHYQAATTTPLLQDDIVLLIANTEQISNAIFLVPQVNNNGDGVQLIYAAYDHDLSKNLNAKAAVGYARADKQNLASRQGKTMGTEYNAQLKYKLDENMSVTGVASYAQIGNYFDTATREADNAYKLLLRFVYAF